LHDPERDDLSEVLGRATEHGGDGEANHSQHEQALAANARADEAGQRHRDRGGDDVGRQHPGDLVLGGAHGALHVRQRHIGDGGVEALHDGRQHHREGDEATIVGNAFCVHGNA